MSITKKQPIKATTPDTPATPVGEIVDAKAKKLENLKNNQKLNCPKCNRAFKKTDSLATHEATCKGGKGDAGGAREGSGRKPGKVSEQKMILKLQKEALQKRIASHADQLFNAQYNLAIGQTMLFVKITERDSKGKPLRTYHERVESQETIKEYLDDPDAQNDDEHYYYITTRPANNQALSNLLDRAFGKPKENIELGEDPDAPLPVHGTGTTTELRKAMLALVKQQIKDGGKKQ